MDNWLVDIINMVEDSIVKLEKWIEDHDYKAYEPFDGLSSSLRPITLGNLFMDRLFLQLIRQSPVNLRPLVRVKPLDSTKGRGYMASGYLTMFKNTGYLQYQEKARLCLEWLIGHKAPGYENYCWANHFDFASRWGRYSKDEPILVWTAIIGQVFLDAFEILEDERYLEIAKSICEWIINLPRENTKTGACISYLAIRQNSVHNANMLGGAMLARTSNIVANKKYLEVAREAMLYSCSRQLPNGAWYYAETPNCCWIDNFHTGYNLDSLKCYIKYSKDETFKNNLKIGFEYYRDTFFEKNGKPKYYHNRTYPVDSQCIAQSIETLANFSDEDKNSLNLCCAVAKWAILNMQDKDGHFYYRSYPTFKVKTAMFHWAQATTYKGLAILLLKMKLMK
jgi:hypothetical protein